MIVMGIDVGGTNLRVGAVNAAGELILSFRESTPQANNPELLLQTICELYTKVKTEVEEKKLGPIQGLGLGWPGAVDRNRGLVLQTPNILGFKDFPLQSVLEKRLRLPIEFENDAKCAGLAEKRFGATQIFQDFILLTFGTGIGGVIFTNGSLVRGRSGAAGEIGHMLLHPAGLPCSCGDRGCFEQYASAKALERRSQQILGEFKSARDILSFSETNDDARRCIQEYIEDLAIGIGSLINIFNPEAIVFSGGLFTSGGGIILPSLQKKLNAQGFQTLKKGVHLTASQLEGKAGIIGAACLMLPSDSDLKTPLK